MRAEHLQRPGSADDQILILAAVQAGGWIEECECHFESDDCDADGGVGAYGTDWECDGGCGAFYWGCGVGWGWG